MLPPEAKVRALVSYVGWLPVTSRICSTKFSTNHCNLTLFPHSWQFLQSLGGTLPAVIGRWPREAGPRGKGGGRVRGSRPCNGVGGRAGSAGGGPRRGPGRRRGPASRAAGGPRPRPHFGRTEVRPTARLTSAKTGKATRSRWDVSLPRSCRTASCCARRKAWLRRISFGAPVEPEVKDISAGSPGASGVRARVPAPAAEGAASGRRQSGGKSFSQRYQPVDEVGLA
jgi:hypothetical protein